MGGAGLDILKGTLEILILKTLSRGPNHGYGIAKWLRDTSDQAFDVEEGVLYPALRRLEKRGLLLADWDLTKTGREAKFYRLSPLGTESLDAAVEGWDRYVAAMDTVLGARRTP